MVRRWKEGWLFGRVARVTMRDWKGRNVGSEVSEGEVTGWRYKGDKGAGGDMEMGGREPRRWWARAQDGSLLDRD